MNSVAWFVPAVVSAFLIALYLLDRRAESRKLKGSIEQLFPPAERERIRKELEKLKNFSGDKAKDAYEAKKAYDRDYRNSND